MENKKTQTNDDWGFPPSNSNQESDFYKIDVGDHKMRILTQPVPVRTYYKDNAFTYVDEDYSGTEKVIIQGWVWAVIRGSEEIKLVKLPYSVIKLIQQLRANDEYSFAEFPMPYDVTIHAVGEKLDREYTITAARKNTEVTDKEMALLEKKTAISDIVKRIREKKEGKPIERVVPEEKGKVEYPEENINLEDIPF